MTVEALIDEHMRVTLGAVEAFQSDPVFHMQVTWLRGMLTKVDEVLAVEGADVWRRERMLRAVLAGVVEDPMDALARVNARVELARRIALN